MRSTKLRWLAAVVVIAAGGTVLSASGAAAWQRQVEQEAEQETARAAADVAGRAAETIRRAMDLSWSFRAALTAEPAMSSEAFDRWRTTLDPFRRLPGLLGLGYVQKVGHPHDAVPTRCPLVLVSSVDPDASIPVGLDLCAPEIGFGPAFGRATDTGLVTIGVTTGDEETRRPLLVGGAVFDGLLADNVHARRHAVVGWAGVLIDGDRLVQLARGEGGRGVWLEISHEAQGQPAAIVGEAGAPPDDRGAIHTTRVAEDGDGEWIIRVAAAPIAGVTASSQGRAVLLAGTALSLLLAALVHVLTRSRDRALHLVARKTDELRHQAMHDPLTDLPNRTMIMDRVRALLDHGDDGCTVMFIDLDDFKDINDTVGHGVGDEVLRLVAHRLAGSVRPGDTVGRLGGDEFVVVLPDEDGAEVVAERIRTAVRQPYQVEGHRPLHVGASIGIATGPRPTPNELLRDADVALYDAKRTGRSRIVVFEPEMRERVQERLDLESALRDALAEKQLFLVYQPILDLRRMQVTGVEALMRWRHPERGVLVPDLFIPIAEQTGLIGSMGRWALHEACRQAADWAAAGVPLDIAVNVSPRQLDDEELVHDVASALRTSGLPAGRLTVELTETSLMADTEAAVARIGALKDLGVSVAIDDFGTGYSSLAYLQQFPVDQLKIDRSFIAAMNSSPEAGLLITTLVHLGRSLGIETLAEGIEEIHQRDELRAQDCDLGQGFLFARPLVAEAIVPFIDHWPPDPTTPGAPEPAPVATSSGA